MLDQALTALAASGGTAVVTAAGTDAWAGLRQAVARWFGRGNAQREQAELERLDQTGAALQAAAPAETERARIRIEASWQARIEAVLESLNEGERDQAAGQLRDLLAQHAPSNAATAGPGGLAVSGNMDIRADGGSIAAGVIHGGAHTGTPPVPDPSQG
ncbi:hypothetical protein [Streptomyces decoyicus]|uniref:hypothetical protein n=1 Tax=Streptomyces decoyicus TaxID=249567 RepID=UPI0004ABD19A|nr:hypothetical protein [Streptomyces decoyicus]KOG47629.1 hypothetical protein ADK74_10645 [Streptomyces decoyicus]QZY19433.1 hypothetical protein K7C20_32905 [Streptomyces decoyicus]